MSRRDSRPADPARFAIPLILAGLAFAADVGSFHVALTGTKVANAAFIGNVAPILTVIGGALFFAERPPARAWPALGAGARRLVDHGRHDRAGASSASATPSRSPPPSPIPLIS